MYKFRNSFLHLQNLVLSLLCVASFSACEDYDKNGKVLDTPTTGEINIGVDESFQPLFMAEIDGFGILYKRAKLNATYKSEGEVLQDFLKDSFRLAVVSRELNEAEKAEFKKQTITPRSHKAAVDAICLIVNSKNIDSAFTVKQVTDMMLGKTSKWNEINPKNIKDSIRIVFDSNNSSNLLWLKSKLNLPETLGKHIFAVNSNSEVVKYVNEHPNTLGVIGISWITDSSANEKEIRRFMQENKVLSVVPDSIAENVKNIHTDLDLNLYFPAQANIARKYYPFCRTVYILSRESRSGLGTGFISYVLGDKGQRIVLKAGLLPFTMPLRLVQMKKMDIK
jgi:phosphate transport system substrate-binding protein